MKMQKGDNFVNVAWNLAVSFQFDWVWRSWFSPFSRTNSKSSCTISIHCCYASCFSGNMQSFSTSSFSLIITIKIRCIPFTAVASIISWMSMQKTFHLYYYFANKNMSNLKQSFNSNTNRYEFVFHPIFCQIVWHWLQAKRQIEKYSGFFPTE